ncbi:MAG: bifunctional glutamate N-acetyltransferase/amino-acid acetyltransferase ArgJ [Rubrobacteraceae bacterium]
MLNKDTEIGIKIVSGGATAPEGFIAGGVACGIRDSGRRDLGILFSEKDCTAAAVFTHNVVKGAPLTVTRRTVEKESVRAVVVNSGNANAATGERGIRDACATQEVAAEALGLPASGVAVASTGVVGELLPMDRISEGIRLAAENLDRDGSGFAEAILTTDTRIKERAIQIEVEGKTVTVGGTAKGSGMIHPNMGTMLAFLTTDAAVEKDRLQETLNRAADLTFNRITVDGDTSPSDMALLLANGAAGNEPLNSSSPDYPVFAKAVKGVALGLAKEIARDGEGATKLVEAVVEGARDEESAVLLAKSIIGSNLVKTAVFGEDANWGRVLVAMGYSGVDFDPAGVELYFGPVKVFGRGEPEPYSEVEASEALRGDEVRIMARMQEGSASATAWGCDLTYKYVEINGSYRT